MRRFRTEMSQVCETLNSRFQARELVFSFQETEIRIIFVPEGSLPHNFGVFGSESNVLPASKFAVNGESPTPYNPAHINQPSNLIAENFYNSINKRGDESAPLLFNKN